MGVFSSVQVGLPGSMRSGLYPRWKSFPASESRAPPRGSGPPAPRSSPGSWSTRGPRRRPGAEVAGHQARRRLDEGEVGDPFVQGGRDVDDGDVEVRPAARDRRWARSARDAQGLLQAVVGDVPDVRAARGQQLDAFGVEIEADDVVADLDGAEGERQPDVALADDGQSSRSLTGGRRGSCRDLFGAGAGCSRRRSARTAGTRPRRRPGRPPGPPRHPSQTRRTGLRGHTPVARRRVARGHAEEQAPHRVAIPSLGGRRRSSRSAAKVSGRRRDRDQLVDVGVLGGEDLLLGGAQLLVELLPGPDADDPDRDVDARPRSPTGGSSARPARGSGRARPSRA